MCVIINCITKTISFFIISLIFIVTYNVCCFGATSDIAVTCNINDANGRINGLVEIRNNTGTIEDVQIEVTGADKTWSFPGISAINQGETIQRKFSLNKNKIALPGIYYFIVTVRYFDSTGHLLSAFGHGILKTNSSSASFVEPQIEAEASLPNLFRDVKGFFRIKSRYDPPLTASYRMFFPEGFVATPSSGTISLTKDEPYKLPFQVKKQGAAIGELPFFLVMNYQYENIHYSLLLPGILTVTTMPLSLLLIKKMSMSIIVVFFIIMLIELFMRKNIINLKEHIVNLLILLFILGFILFLFQPSLLFTDSTIAGGDTPSLLASAQAFANKIFSKGALLGWLHENHGGYPFIQFYFPLPFIMTALLSLFIPLTISFKLITVLGVVFLPVSVFTFMKIMKFTYPIPIVSAILSLPFLTNSSYAVWGGNISSVLAGEFSYQISLSIVFIFLGMLWSGWNASSYEKADWLYQRSWKLNAICLAFVGLTHGYTFVWALCAGFGLFVFSHTKAQRWFLFRVYGIAALLLLFFFIPWLLCNWITTPEYWVWQLDFPKDLFPAFFVFILIMACFAIWVTLRKRDLRTFYFLGLSFFAIILFMSAFLYKMVDIRSLPLAYFPFILLASIALGELFRRINRQAILVLLTLSVTFFLILNFMKDIPQWIAWNYSGFENKNQWHVYKDTMDALRKSGTGRIAWEHSNKYEVYGTIRAFEIIPYFSGRETLEGVYLRSSILSPFVYYIQSEISKISSCAIDEFPCTYPQVARGIKHLLLLGTNEVLVRSEEMKKAFLRTPGVSKLMEVAPFTIFKFGQNKPQYVVPLYYEPVVYMGADWKQKFFSWFRAADYFDPVLVSGAINRRSVTDDFRFFIGGNDIAVHNPVPIAKSTQVKEVFKNNEINIETTTPGVPLLVKISYHPFWRVEGANGIYLASPAFMLIIPTEKQVKMWFSPPIWYWFCVAISAGALLFMIVYSLGKFKYKDNIYDNQQLFSSTIKNKKPVAAIILLVIIFILAGIIRHTHPIIKYAKAYNAYSRDDIKMASILFYNLKEKGGRYPQLEASGFFLAFCYYKVKLYRQALSEFKEFSTKYPYHHYVPEAIFHEGRCLEEIGNIEEARKIYYKVKSRYPDTKWAQFAQQKITTLLLRL